MKQNKVLLPVVILLASLCPLWLSGCQDKKKLAHEMSDYPYYIKRMDARWGIALKSLRQDDPAAANVSFAAVMETDLQNALDVMQATYHAANREAALAKLQQMLAEYRKDLSTQVDMTHGSVVLLKGVTHKDVCRTLEKAYAEYPKFREMVKL